MENKKELLERLDIMTQEGDLKCYALITDKGCSIVGSSPELLTILSLFVDTLYKKGNDISKELIKKAVEIGLAEKQEKIDMLKENLIKLKELMEEM